MTESTQAQDYQHPQEILDLLTPDMGYSVETAYSIMVGCRLIELADFLSGFSQGKNVWLWGDRILIHAAMAFLSVEAAREQWWLSDWAGVIQLANEFDERMKVLKGQAEDPEDTEVWVGRKL